jgi:hypothetical protein
MVASRRFEFQCFGVEFSTAKALARLTLTENFGAVWPKFITQVEKSMESFHACSAGKRENPRRPR